MSLCGDLGVPNRGSSGQHVDFEVFVSVAYGGSAAVGQIATTADCNSEGWFHTRLNIFK